jgi:hypothetical protein
LAVPSEEDALLLPLGFGDPGFGTELIESGIRFDCERLRNTVLAYQAGDVEQEICAMTDEEKRAMKPACVQAAATLIAARDRGKDQIDVDECITLAAVIYVRVVTTDWRDPA